jgi:hypothetical protein
LKLVAYLKGTSLFEGSAKIFDYQKSSTQVKSVRTSAVHYWTGVSLHYWLPPTDREWPTKWTAHSNTLYNPSLLSSMYMCVCVCVCVCVNLQQIVVVHVDGVGLTSQNRGHQRAYCSILQVICERGRPRWWWCQLGKLLIRLPELSKIPTSRIWNRVGGMDEWVTNLRISIWDTSTHL